MPKPIVNGTMDPVAQPTEVVFDPVRGLQLILRWESAGDNLAALANGYSATGVAYRMVRSSQKSTLEATAAGAQAGYAEVTTDTWEILANEIQKDLHEFPAAAALGIDTLNTIDDAVANRTNPGLGGDAGTVFTLLKQGTTHYALGQYVLRHTTNVSNTYAANISDSNIECLYTTAQLLAEVTDATLWANPMPGRMQYKIQAITAPTARSGFLWSWRKLPSTETTAAGNRVNIVTEYWLEQWSTFVYATLP